MNGDLFVKMRSFLWLMLVIVLALAPLFACSSAHRNRPIEEDFEHQSDLSLRDFSFASFCGVSLAGKILRKADFGYATLQGVDFTSADMQEADLSHADARFAIFRQVNMENAILENTSLFGADFTDAVLSAKWERIIPLITSGNGNGADLRNYDLRHVIFYGGNSKGDCPDIAERVRSIPPFQLNNASLQGADLTGAVLMYSDARNTNFAGAVLHGASLSHAYLENTIFNEADLTQIGLGNSVLIHAQFRDADLTNGGLPHANLQFADFRGAILKNTDLSYADLRNALITPEQLATVEWLHCTILPDGTVSPPNENYIYATTPCEREK